jgi:disulfide bond formation protein DsbB
MTDEQQQTESSEESDSDYSGGLAPLIIAAVIVVVTALGVFALLNLDDDDEVTAAAAATETTAADGATDTTAASEDGGGGGDPVAGEATYQGTCSACHAPDATGITGLGLPLANSEFVQSMTDEELVAFIAVGRDAGDPDNTTGVGMPPKGGNPSLTDEDLLNVVAWLRTLQ